MLPGRRDRRQRAGPTRTSRSRRWRSRSSRDPLFGKLTYVRVYSGTLAPGSQVINSTKDRKERIGKIYQMHANKRDPVDEARPAGTSSR